MASRISKSVEEEDRERAPAADCPLWKDPWSVLDNMLLFSAIIRNLWSSFQFQFIYW